MKNRQEQSPRGVLKMYSKFTEEHPCRSVISIKLSCNFIEIALRHRCSPVNLLHIFRTPFPRNTSGWLLLNRSWYLYLYSYSCTCICICIHNLAGKVLFKVNSENTRLWTLSMYVHFVATNKFLESLEPLSVLPNFQKGSQSDWSFYCLYRSIPFIFIPFAW